MIKVMEGEYSVPTSMEHLNLKNYVRIVGTNKYKCIVSNIHSQNAYSATVNTFDTDGSESIKYASIENVTIKCKGGKGPIHIDGPSLVSGGLIEIKNCIL